MTEVEKLIEGLEMLAIVLKDEGFPVAADEINEDAAMLRSQADALASSQAEVERLKGALSSAADSFNRIVGAALKLETKAAMAIAISALDQTRAALAGATEKEKQG